MKQAVSLKGVKNGYQLQIEEDSSFSLALEELQALLEKMKEDHSLSSEKEDQEIPLVIKTGNRYLTDSEREKLTSVVTLHSQFNVSSFESNVVPLTKAYEWHEKNSVQLKMGTIRSGQVIESPGDLLFVGNVNPGGVLQAAGSIFIIGEFRGIAHAGFEGNQQTVVVADYRFSSQVRIADNVHVVEEKEEPNGQYEAAYINELDVYEFHPVNQLANIRPELGEMTGRLQ